MDMKIQKSLLNTMLVCLISISLMNCSRSKSEESRSENVIPVKVQPVQPIGASVEKEYVGTVEESSSSSLSFQVAGNVQQVLVSEGQSVKKGQLLAVLDKSRLISAHQAALATLKQAQDAYNRLTQLHDNQSLPEIRYVEMQTNLEKARSAESIARKSLRDGSLYAPFSGVIGVRSIEPGMNVMPSQSAFTLLDIDQLKVKVSIPENEIANTHVGQTAKLFITALGDKCNEGVITQKGIVANSLSHTYEVKIRVNQPDREMMPGMVCKVFISSSQSCSRIIVPNQAVQIMQSGDKYVWVTNGNKAVRRSIQSGELTDYGVTVTDGLRQGDQVIVEGYQKISEGSKIKLL